jgi:hypothetical protein
MLPGSNGMMVHDLFIGDGRHSSSRPGFKRPQAETLCPEMRANMRAKLTRVLEWWCITPAFVLSLTSFFAVSNKGTNDIQMVYDASISGFLNDSSIWVPWFPLPTIRTHLHTVEEGTYIMDLDIG